MEVKEQKWNNGRLVRTDDRSVFVISRRIDSNQQQRISCSVDIVIKESFH